MPKRLPPRSTTPRQLVGVTLESYTIGSWCSSNDGSGTPEAVVLSLQMKEFSGEIMLRLKTPSAVDTMIQALLRHKRDVWPEST